MVGRPLPRDDVWRLVSYLSHLMAAQPRRQQQTDPKPALASFEPVTPDELRAADDHPADWLTYSGSYAAHRYSRLRQINRDNVGQLRLEWARQFLTTDGKGRDVADRSRVGDVCHRTAELRPRARRRNGPRALVVYARSAVATPPVLRPR